jgi:flagellar hook-associated protein 3 FlgL
MTTVSTSAFYDRSIWDLSALRKQADGLQQQISTGNRLSTASQDPVAAARIASLTRQDSLAKVDGTNAQAAQNDLELADSTLTNFSTIVTQIQGLATQAASATLNNAQRGNVGAEVSALRDQLVSLANARDSSGYALFGGTGTGQAYTLDAAGNATYAGAATADTISLGQGLSVTRGVTGPEFMNFNSGGTATDLLSMVKTLADALNSGAGGQAAAQTALTKLGDGLNAITTAQTVVGARLSWIDTTTAIRDQFSQQRADTEASVGGTDIASTVARLQQTMTVLEASQASFAKLAGMSLFDMLR